MIDLKKHKNLKALVTQLNEEEVKLLNKLTEFRLWKLNAPRHTDVKSPQVAGDSGEG